MNDRVGGLFGLVISGAFVVFAGNEIICGLSEVVSLEKTGGVVTGYTAPDRNAADDLAAGQIRYEYSLGGWRHQGRFPPSICLDAAHSLCSLLHILGRSATRSTCIVRVQIPPSAHWIPESSLRRLSF